MTATGRPDTRSGRPRRPEVDDAIHRATLRLLAERGYDALTIDAVAASARVGRPTVYRRHVDKASLVAAAFRAELANVNPAAPDTGDPNTDLRALLRNTARLLETTPFGAAIREIVGPAHHDPALGALFDEVVGDRRLLLLTVLRRAADAGRLAAPDPETGADLVLGALYHRHWFSRRPLSAVFVARVVDTVVRRD